MKKKLLVLHILFLVSYCSFSQGIGIGTTTPDASAVLDITHSSKGLLIPRMNAVAIFAIANPAGGLLVYDSVANQLMVNMGTPATPNWQTIVSRSGWGLTGNSGINPANQFIGNTDNQPLRFRINNIVAGELHPATGNIFWGLRAGQANTTGFSNIAIGTDALTLNTFRSNLVAIGDSALFHNSQGNNNPTEAVFNIAIGSKSLFSNIRGRNNTAIGFQSLFTNTLSSENTAVGFQSLFSNRGSDNTAVGIESLKSNNLGNFNTGMGRRALFSNTDGDFNTGIGELALASNTVGHNNTALGRGAMSENISGNFNVGIGFAALSLTTGSEQNTMVGFAAGSLFNMGFNNTLIGSGADVNQNGLFNCVALGQAATCTASSQVRFGNTSTGSIGGFVGYTTIPSDRRYKKNIQEAVKGIDFIMRLRPVTYQLDIAGLNKKLNGYAGGKIDDRLKEDMDEKGKTIFSGFVAQEVEEAAKAVGYDFSGVDKPKNENDMYGLRYAEFVVPLVKAVQEQQQIINELRKRLDDLERKVK